MCMTDNREKILKIREKILKKLLSSNQTVANMYHNIAMCLSMGSGARLLRFSCSSVTSRLSLARYLTFLRLSSSYLKHLPHIVIFKLSKCM